MFKRITGVFIFGLVFVSFLVCFSQETKANGAVWNPAPISGSPRPVKQDELILNKEHVFFKDDQVNANFWVFNPTKNSKSVTMGFPLEYREYMKQSQGLTEGIEGYVKELLNNFKITVNGQVVPAQLTQNLKNDYPIVINWEMVFLAEKITEFTVQYPMRWANQSGDNPGIGSEWSRSFSYITHTGAYWAQPIKEAIFEYCDEGASFLMEYPSGEYEEWKNNGWSVEHESVGVNPKPTKLDWDTTCIKWEMKNWTPQKGKDDIGISIRGDGSDYTISLSCGENGNDEFWTSVMKHWCGRCSKNDKKQFSAQMKLDKVRLSSRKFEDLVKESYVYITGRNEESNGDWDDPFYEFPEHLATDYQLNLLKYLRNSIYARYGHEFKDNELANCFSNVKVIKGSLNEIEKENVKYIQTLEKQIGDKNQKAWLQVRKLLRK